MLLFCCFTPAHEILFRQVFLPSVPEGFEVRPSALGIEGPGDYLSDEFLRCIRAKLDLVVRSVAENPGDIIVWSDVDIRFFRLASGALTAELEASECDILFQRESPRMDDVNTGFFVCRCTPAVLEFFTAVRSELASHREGNEQMAVNRLLLKENHDHPVPQISWNYLPRNFYARTHGWPPPRHLAIYHANYTKGRDGVGQKVRQFQEIAWIDRWGVPAWLWSVLRRIPGKLIPR
jgi:hypothetical protein